MVVSDSLQGYIRHSRSEGSAIFSSFLLDSCLKKEITMLWTVFVILLVLWFLGFSLHVGGSVIHALLVIALIVLIFNLVTGRRSR